MVERISGSLPNLHLPPSRSPERAILPLGGCCIEYIIMRSSMPLAVLPERGLQLLQGRDVREVLAAQPIEDHAAADPGPPGDLGNRQATGLYLSADVGEQVLCHRHGFDRPFHAEYS